MATEAKGEYGTLKAGAGFLIGQTTVDTLAAPEAVAAADNVVADIFASWDRSTWKEGNPPTIHAAWLKLATGEYLDRIQGANTHEEGGGGRASRLRREGLKDLRDIADAGGPLVNGEQQTKRDGGSGGDDRRIALRVG